MTDNRQISENGERTATYPACGVDHSVLISALSEDENNLIHKITTEFIKKRRENVAECYECSRTECYKCASEGHGDLTGYAKDFRDHLEKELMELKQIHFLQNLENKTTSGYKFESKIGSGGRGVVYKATQISLNRSVAIKFAKIQDEDHEHKHKLSKDEAGILACMNHHNIARVYDIVNFGKDDFPEDGIIMEYIDSKNLHDTLEKLGQEKMPWLQVLDIIKQVAQGLKEAHERKIFHGDIKPKNIMMIPKSNVSTSEREYDVKVIDFGAGITLGYTAPERIKGSKADIKADIYSLGCVFFRILSGKEPKQVQDYQLSFGDCDNIEEKGDAEKFLVRMCALDPNYRYKDTKELIKDITDYKLQRVGAHSPSVAKKLNDAELEATRVRYLGEFHNPPPNKRRAGVQHLLGPETFDWHWILTAAVDDDVNNTLENRDNPLGYRIYILESSFNRLWDKDKKAVDGRLPEDYDLFCDGNGHIANDGNFNQNVKKRYDYVSRALFGDEYKLSFQDALLDTTNTVSGHSYIECPKENFEHETTDFKKYILDSLKKRQELADEYNFSLPPFATKFLNPTKPIACCNNCSPDVIGFLRERAESARNYINNIKDVKKKNALMWAFHPIFDYPGNENYKANFFLRIKQFHEKVFVSWDYIFINGSVVNNPDHLVEIGRRLNREMQTFMSLRSFEKVEEFFSLSESFDTNNIHDLTQSLNLNIKHYWWQLYRLAMSMGAPYLHLPEKDKDNAIYIFSKTPIREHITPSADEEQSEFETVVRGAEAKIRFFVAEEIELLLKRAKKYCKKMKNTEDFYKALKHKL